MLKSAKIAKTIDVGRDHVRITRAIQAATAAAAKAAEPARKRRPTKRRAIIVGHAKQKARAYMLIGGSNDVGMLPA